MQKVELYLAAADKRMEQVDVPWEVRRVWAVRNFCELWKMYPGMPEVEKKESAIQQAESQHGRFYPWLRFIEEEV